MWKFIEKLVLTVVAAGAFATTVCLMQPRDTIAQYLGGGRGYVTFAQLSDSLDARADSTGVITMYAGDTTSPGMAYYMSSQDTMSRADTSVGIRAIAIALDSVPMGQQCHFRYWGEITDADWSWTAGDNIFSDSAIAGALSTGGQAAPKKMQYYGTAISPTTILVKLDGTLAY